MEYTVEEIANLFHAVDQDKNGKLSFEEVADVMTQLKGGTRPIDEEIKLCMRSMDTNGDGVISEEEFLQAMLSWLELQGSTKKKGIKRSVEPESPETFDRKKTLTDMANFFRQFSTIPDFHEEQRRILSQARKRADMTGVQREYPSLSSEEQALTLQAIQGVLSEGREVLVREMFSLDWNIVLVGLNKIALLLSIVEVFPTADQR
jgi:hypothetical protein